MYKIKQEAQPKVVSNQKLKVKYHSLGQLEMVKNFKINYVRSRANTGERLENLNSQLSLFLKTYKITKNINNYLVLNQNKQTLIKKLNHLIVKNKFLVNSSLLNNPNRSVEFLKKVNFNKSKKDEKQVLLNPDNHKLLINFLTNNKVIDKASLRSHTGQGLENKKLFKNRMLKTAFPALGQQDNAQEVLPSWQASLQKLNKSSWLWNTKHKCLTGNSNSIGLFKPIPSGCTFRVNQARTYNFLQISLIKYLAIRKKRKKILQEKAFLVFGSPASFQLLEQFVPSHKTLKAQNNRFMTQIKQQKLEGQDLGGNKLQSPLSLLKINQATRLLPKTSLILNSKLKQSSLAAGYSEYGLKIKPSPRDYTLNFLLKDKINNKTFLTYWLIPLAGLAFLSPNTFVYMKMQLPLYLISCNKNTSPVTNEFKEINPICFNNLNLYINTKHEFNKIMVNTAPSARKHVLAYLWEGIEVNPTLTDNLKIIDNKTNSVSTLPPKSIVQASHPLFGNFKSTLLKNIRVDYLGTSTMEKVSSNSAMHLNSTLDSPKFQKGKLLHTKSFQDYPVQPAKSKSSMLLKTVILSNTKPHKANLINPIFSKVILEKNLNFLTTSARGTNQKSLKLLKFKIFDYTILKNNSKIFSTRDNQKPLINYQKTLKRISILKFFINQEVINLTKSNQSKSVVNIKEFFDSKSTLNENILYMNLQQRLQDNSVLDFRVNLQGEPSSNLTLETPFQILFNTFTQDFNNKLNQKMNGVIFRHKGLSPLEKKLDFKNTKNTVFTNYFSIIGIGENFNTSLWDYYGHINTHTLKRKLDSSVLEAQYKGQVPVTRNNTQIWAKTQPNTQKISLLTKKINLITTNTKLGLNLQNNFRQINPQYTGGLLPLEPNSSKTKVGKHSIFSKPFMVLTNQKILTKNENLTNSYFHYITNKLKKFIGCNTIINTKTPILSKQKNLVSSVFKAEVKGSISMIFKLKKMFKNNISLTNLKASHIERYKKQSLKCTNSKGVFFGEEEGLNQRRLSLQKKRKAKKQRLETRQRKKRTRFFPRPTWLRYRMFVDFLKQRNLTYLIKPNSYKNNTGLALTRQRDISALVQRTISEPRDIGPEVTQEGLTQKSKLNKSFFFSEYKKNKLNLFKHTKKKNYPSHLWLDSTKAQGNLKPGNYVNFEKKTSQPPIDKDKEKDKDTIFRDIWVWGYNNTALNNYQQNLIFLLPNNKKILNTQKASLFSLTSPKSNPLKTFNFSFRGNLPGFVRTHKLDTRVLEPNKIQPNKQNLTKYNLQKILQMPDLINTPQILQNKNVLILTRLQWALNKTQTSTFTEGNKRYTLWGQRKLRNQSKNNKTKYLEKQFITNWERFFLNKKLNHLYKKIGNKIQHKIKKLNYLTTYSKYDNYMSQLGLTNKPVWDTEKDSIKTNKYLPTTVPNTSNITLFNNAWWTNSAKNVWFLSSKVKSKHTITINSFLKNDLVQRKNIDNKLLDNKNTINISSTVIFHFCALISLVSISQVRCYIKFYIIFLYKLKNLYLFLITKISGIVKNNVEFLNSSNKSLNKTLKANHTQTNSFKGKVGSNNSNGVKNNSLMLLKKTNKEQQMEPPTELTNLGLGKLLAPARKLDTSVLELKLFTVIGLSLLKKHFKLRTKTANIFSFTTSSQILRAESLSSKANITKVKYPRNSLLISIRQKSFSKNTRAHVNNQTFTKSNLISLKENFNIFNTKIKQNKLIAFSSLPNSYKTKKIKFFLKKNTLAFLQEKKTFVFKSVFMFVDLFQLGIRAIKDFFFKPAEFTTNWVAFAFLVEWSSDLITIIPENIDIYLWTAFAKVSRNTNNLLIWNNFGIQTKNQFSMFFVVNNSSNSENFVTNLVQTTQPKNYALLQLPSLILLNYLIQRRILYLFDKFIETISQPDTDLMRRQIKGTRFWDIWADFLVFFADYYNVNVFALSTIKSEQNNLIEKITNSTWLDKKPSKTPVSSLRMGARFGFKDLTSSFKMNLQGEPSSLSFQQKQIKTPNDFFNKYNLLAQGDHTLSLTNINRWSINQYITYQSWHSHNGSNNSNGDLFIDYHPPKSFSHLPNIKYNKILLRPIGTLVCQINSGLLKRQVSKNILLVSPKNTFDGNASKEETINKPVSNRDQILTDYNILLIQALAGETELKIITDNAQRYALVNRGFAVGIKLLRDVFDAISLNTPCIFLLLDIHTIGERRPMLISDYGAKNTDDNGLFKEDFFGSQRDEVHEKNQVVYQLTRHAIAHYRKPFKGDYSLAIPTNLYSFQELARSLPTQTTTNLSLISFNNVTMKPKINYTNPNKSILNKKSNDKPAALVIGTHLKLKKLKKKIAPPSTSPFTVLLLKEEKKLKPNKIVEEFPWTGLPGEELATKARTSYSVRAKVSMLAELSLSNLSAKLDMITDLLVIIDSVRSNKGFVVFATTNVPQVLDPALRRPGRLDETICIPNISSSGILNFTTNYEIIKSVKDNFSGLALFSYALPGVRFNKNLALLVSNKSASVLGGKNKNKVPFQDPGGSSLHTLVCKGGKTNTQNSLSKMLFATQRKILTVNLFDLNTVLKEKASNFNNNLNNYALISDQNRRKRKMITYSHISAHNSLGKVKTLNSNRDLSFSQARTKLSVKALAYYQVGNILLHYYLNNYTRISAHISKPPGASLRGRGRLGIVKEKEVNYLTWDTKNIVIKQLMSLFGGKISQLLAIEKNLSYNVPHLSQDRSFVDSRNKLSDSSKDNLFNFDMSDISSKTKNFQIATKIMLSFIHKRYLYRKNLIVPKLLSFSDGTVLDEPPSPPFSSLLIPAKRFENYTRVFSDLISGTKFGQRKAQISFTEKINYHMELQSIKLLKNKQKITPSNSSSYETLLKMTIADKQLQTPTNINWYYQNRILKRHGQYLTNQWWNGQLSEHNAETVFLSDIDWRSSFIQNKQIQVKSAYAGYNFENLKNTLVSLEKTKDKFLAQKKQNKHFNASGLDILLDFPDTDQYYNPRRRRWLLNKGDWSFWFNFDKVYSEEIVSSWILESLINTYTYLHNNLELLDFITTKFITLGYTKSDKFTINVTQTEYNFSKEIILTNTIKRF
jgi:hypothetical protein